MAASRPPQMLETSLPGVFAVGDVRSGNVKLVASAVGEGAISVHMVHQALVELQKMKRTGPRFDRSSIHGHLNTHSILKEMR